MLNKIPKKMAGPGSMTLPCQFCNHQISHALDDSGAGVNLMHYSFYAKLDLLEPKPVRMAIHLANKSVTYPRGIVDDLLVKIDKFIFPADFIIIDMEEDAQVPIILGRPFFSTARALFDIHESQLTLRVGTDVITFGVNKSMKHSKTSDDYVYYVDSIDLVLKNELTQVKDEDLEGQMMLKEEDMDPEKVIEELEKLLAEPETKKIQVLKIQRRRNASGNITRRVTRQNRKTFQFKQATRRVQNSYASRSLQTADQFPN